MNIRRASTAQHLAAIALAYTTHVRLSASPLRGLIVTELETLSGRKRSRTTTDLHIVVERFVSYGGENPAELHAWARQSAVTKRTAASSPDAIAAKRQAKAEARQRALTHEVTITTRRPDGTRKGRQRYAITGVLSTEIAALRVCAKKLAARTGFDV